MDLALAQRLKTLEDRLATVERELAKLTTWNQLQDDDLAKVRTEVAKAVSDAMFIRTVIQQKGGR